MRGFQRNETLSSIGNPRSECCTDWGKYVVILQAEEDLWDNTHKKGACCPRSRGTHTGAPRMGAAWRLLGQRGCLRAAPPVGIRSPPPPVHVGTCTFFSEKEVFSSSFPCSFCFLSWCESSWWDTFCFLKCGLLSWG